MQDQHTSSQEIREPLVLLLTELLADRLRKLSGAQMEIVVPSQSEDTGFQVPQVPDWKDSGFLLSANFSRFVDELDFRLFEEAGIDSPASGPEPGNRPKEKRSAIKCLSPGDAAEETPQKPTRLNHEEKWILIIALVPHIYPHFYDGVIYRYLQNSGEYPEMGFVRGKDFRGCIPTGETVFFLLAGNDFEKRLEIQKLFHPDHFFARKKILQLEELAKGDPVMSGKLVLAQDYLDMILFGKPVPPGFSISFPAKEIKTSLDWDDLVTGPEQETHLNNIMSWLQYNDRLLKNMKMSGRLRKGYRCLFYGPPGTGKTFTAGLLGKCAGKPVYKIDLSMVVSKYIGETEKNLEVLFARAEDKGWILFFDEADALFGKRTSVRDAHDKYANQEVSYLLQRIEEYGGLVILASNLKNNIDDAFIRRFNAIIRFPFPDEGQRAGIWRVSFPRHARFKTKPEEEEELFPEMEAEQDIDIPGAVGRYELTGGSINNIVHYACLKAVERMEERLEKAEHLKQFSFNEEFGEYFVDEDCYPGPEFTIYLSDVLKGIEMELVKEGKPFTI